MMRLIHVYDLKLQEFDDGDIPPYTIASHRWYKAPDEACLEDFRTTESSEKPGMQKIKGFCEFVRYFNDLAKVCAGTKGRPPPVRLEWLWIDTCCVDQKSSADLTESINSMWKYYQQAYICFAHLNDVADLEGFQCSVWFDRGWTLQELIAPGTVVFLNSKWDAIGHKCPYENCRACPSHDMARLNSLIADRTGIPTNVLENSQAIAQIPMIDRMRWIQNRKTKKKEDLAYCLLGICGVFMGLIYGEGENAWQRLEEELAKKYGQPVQLSRPEVLCAPESNAPMVEYGFLGPPLHVPMQWGPCCGQPVITYSSDLSTYPQSISTPGSTTLTESGLSSGRFNHGASNKPQSMPFPGLPQGEVFHHLVGTSHFGSSAHPQVHHYELDLTLRGIRRKTRRLLEKCRLAKRRNQHPGALDSQSYDEDNYDEDEYDEDDHEYEDEDDDEDDWKDNDNDDGDDWEDEDDDDEDDWEDDDETEGNDDDGNEQRSSSLDHG